MVYARRAGIRNCGVRDVLGDSSDARLPKARPCRPFGLADAGHFCATAASYPASLLGVLPPRAIRPFLHYFDEIDETVARRMLRSRPWSEISLTSLLCDVMDENVDTDYPRTHDRAWLIARLAQDLPLLHFDCSIETHEYKSGLERWATQSDLGVVIVFRDHLLRGRDWERAYLLQAKTLYQKAGAFPLDAVYGAMDKAQQGRANRINQHLGYELIRYLLYVPRPARLPSATAATLRHLRDVNIAEEIFDFSRGLELYANMIGDDPILDAGLVVAPAVGLPHTFADTYAQLFKSSLPWAWFLTDVVTNSGNLGDLASGGSMWDNATPANQDLMLGIVRGEGESLSELTAAVDGLEDRPFTVLPAHTITITVEVGTPNDPDRAVLDLLDRRN